MTYNILVATTLADDVLAVLRQAPDVTVTVVKPESPAVYDAIETADALLVRDDVPVDTHLLSGARRLKVIGRAGAGLAGIDVDAATARGVIVMNTPGTNAIAVAEHTMTLLLALSR